MNDTEKQTHQRDRRAENGYPPRLAEDQFYRALASRRRRRVLYYLLETTDSTVEELATVLSGWEAATTETMQTPTDRSAIHLDLVHSHLPRLADSGLVTYEPNAGTVQLDPIDPQVAQIIRQSVEAEALDDS